VGFFRLFVKVLDAPVYADARIAEVERLLALGWNIPKVARKTGVDKAVVLQVRGGVRPSGRIELPPAPKRIVQNLDNSKVAKTDKKPPPEYTSLLFSIADHSPWQGSILEDDLIRRGKIAPRPEHKEPEIERDE
jgi:hypothetical protein